jgi:hypothetical protein
MALPFRQPISQYPPCPPCDALLPTPSLDSRNGMAVPLNQFPNILRVLRAMPFFRHQAWIPRDGVAVPLNQFPNILRVLRPPPVPSVR